jgi:hypothetical protein
MLIMKKISIMMAVLVAFSGLISAGPLFDKNPTPVLQAPAPPNWTGVYCGVFGGYKNGAADHDLALGGTFNRIPPVKSAFSSRARQAS